MFDIGWSEMAVILLVALIVIGPKDLPRVARTLGRWAGKGRAMAREFQTALEDMAREAELDKVKEEIEKAGRTNLGKSIEKTIDPTGELGRAFDPTAGSRKRPGAETASKAPAAKPLDTPSSAKSDQPSPAAVAAPEPAPAAAASADPAAGNSGSGKSSAAKTSPSRKASSGKAAAAKPSAGNSAEERPKAAAPERAAPEPAPVEPS